MKTLFSHLSSNNSHFAKSKKCIGPVVAIALLIVVAVSSVIALQTWFETYSSNIETKVEKTNENTISIDLVFVEKENNTIKLYYNNPSTKYLVIDNIKINSNLCTLVTSDVLIDESISEIDVEDCTLESGEESEIVLISARGLFTEKFRLK